MACSRHQGENKCQDHCNEHHASKDTAQNDPSSVTPRAISLEKNNQLIRVSNVLRLQFLATLLILLEPNGQRAHLLAARSRAGLLSDEGARTRIVEKCCKFFFAQFKLDLSVDGDTGIDGIDGGRARRKGDVARDGQ